MSGCLSCCSCLYSLFGWGSGAVTSKGAVASTPVNTEISQAVETRLTSVVNVHQTAIRQIAAAQELQRNRQQVSDNTSDSRQDLPVFPRSCPLGSPNDASIEDANPLDLQTENSQRTQSSPTSGLNVSDRVENPLDDLPPEIPLGAKTRRTSGVNAAVFPSATPSLASTDDSQQLPDAAEDSSVFSGFRPLPLQNEANPLALPPEIPKGALRRTAAAPQSITSIVDSIKRCEPGYIAQRQTAIQKIVAAQGLQGNRQQLRDNDSQQLPDSSDSGQDLPVFASYSGEDVPVVSETHDEVNDTKRFCPLRLVDDSSLKEANQATRTTPSRSQRSDPSSI